MKNSFREHLKNYQCHILKFTNSFLIISETYINKMHNNFILKLILYNEITIFYYFIFKIYGLIISCQLTD